MDNQILQGKYWAVYMPSHHLAKSDGYVYVHRLNAEKKLGRQLKKTEVVHHIDMNKLNNSLDNLMIFKTNADQVGFHKGNPIECIDGVWYCPKLQLSNYQKDKKLCPKCKINFMSYASDMCIKCWNKKVKQETKKPSKDILEKEILSMSFVAIGEKYGVTDNAVRRWCDTYNLPTKRNDIKIYKEKILL